MKGHTLDLTERKDWAPKVTGAQKEKGKEESGKLLLLLTIPTLASSVATPMFTFCFTVWKVCKRMLGDKDAISTLPFIHAAQV